MGLLRNILLILLPFLFYGCLTQSIKLPEIKRDPDGHTIYGKTSSREFLKEISLGSNFSKRWEASANGNFNNNSVVVYDKYVFINDLSGRIFCFSLDNGKAMGSVKNDGVIYTAPVIENFIMAYAVALVKRNESTIIFYDIITGKVRNSENVTGRIELQPVKHNEDYIFISESGVIYKYGLDGQKKWELNSGGRTHSNPALYRDYLVFGNDNAEVIVVDVKEQQILFRKGVNKPLFGGAMINDEKIYIGDDSGTLYSFDLRTGEELWQYQTGARIIMTPAFDNENIYVGNLRGDLLSLTKTGDLNWKSYVGGILNASPLITNDKIYQPNLNGNLLIIEKSDGEIFKSIAETGRLKITPVYEKNLLFIGYDNGMLSAYEIH
jgi:outer membrane protein assembly factor BamB